MCWLLLGTTILDVPWKLTPAQGLHWKPPGQLVPATAPCSIPSPLVGGFSQLPQRGAWSLETPVPSLSGAARCEEGPQVLLAPSRAVPPRKKAAFPPRPCTCPDLAVESVLWEEWVLRGLSSTRPSFLPTEGRWPVWQPRQLLPKRRPERLPPDLHHSAPAAHQQGGQQPGRH